MELQEAWDVAAKHIVDSSNNPNNPHICLFIYRQVDFASESYQITLSKGMGAGALLTSKPYPWVIDHD